MRTVYLNPYVYRGVIFYDYDFVEDMLPPLTDEQRAKYQKIFDELKAWVKDNNIKIVLHKARERKHEMKTQYVLRNEDKNYWIECQELDNRMRISPVSEDKEAIRQLFKDRFPDESLVEDNS